MRRLSSDHASLEAEYDAVVIGTGYGGGVAASRLARMGLKVCVLERGREFAAGDFPDTMAAAERELQIHGPDGRAGPATGLYDLKLGRDMHVLVGCGLGGTSLINANVALPPDHRVWEDPAWPHEIVADDTLNEGFRRAGRMLRPAPFPNTVRLDKLKRLEEAAQSIGAEAVRPPLNIAFSAGPNSAGVDQLACTLCGDCCSGCNVGAKTTVDITYIADAVNHGAAVFTEIHVRHVARAEHGWRIIYDPQRAASLLFQEPERVLAASIVVLAAGSLGSTEILLRSKAEGLAVSPRLGQGFTGNGDVLAFAYNNERVVNGIGVGITAHRHVPAPGPCIAGLIDLRGSRTLNEGLVIEEGVIPSALHTILPALFDGAANLFGRHGERGVAATLQETLRRHQSLLLGAYQGALHNTQTVLVMAHDDGSGRLRLEDDRIGVHWPDAARQRVFASINETLGRLTAATGGNYVRNPLQSTFLGETLVTVHPLGGCGMGEDGARGVVDHKCRVFDGGPGAPPGAVHGGLYVCDGSVMPRPLGVNPLLTITAVAERAMIHLAADLGLALDDAAKVDAPKRSAAAGISGSGAAAGIVFTERMTGFVGLPNAAAGTDGYRASADYGRAAGGAIAFTVTIDIDAVDRFIADPDRTGWISGTVECPLLSPEPLAIAHGRFSLMRPDPSRPEARRFDYAMDLATRDGRTFAFAGQKLIHADRAPGDIWTDTTTLFVDIAETTLDAASPVHLAGVLTIALGDFARQLQTLKGKGGTSAAERLRAVTLFGATFAGSLFDVYGGSLRPLDRFDAATARRRRELRAPAPDVRHVETADGLDLRLTRYRGGRKGPLLFLHGLGVSSRIFTIDTIATNLVEYMVAAGYDCWLLDYRASTDLPYARLAATADAVALNDIPAAVHAILKATGAPHLQVLAHCFGATTFTMAMLAGLDGVRSAVISQVSTDVIVPWWPQRLLAHLRIPGLLAALGISAVDARATRADGLRDRFVDGLIRLALPFRSGDRSRNATSNRITALYGPLYELANLDRQTLEQGVPEMFGAANIAAFQQLAAIARKKRLVDANGRDTYLANTERLAIPITFIHGAKNACFAPESTARTVERLSKRNGSVLYRRHVVAGYGHIDCIFGRNAASDVFPLMLAHLDETGV